MVGFEDVRLPSPPRGILMAVFCGLCTLCTLVGIIPASIHIRHLVVPVYCGYETGLVCTVCTNGGFLRFPSSARGSPPLAALPPHVRRAQRPVVRPLGALRSLMSGRQGYPVANPRWQCGGVTGVGGYDFTNSPFLICHEA